MTEEDKQLMLENEENLSPQQADDGAELDVFGEILPGVLSAFKKLDQEGRRKLFRTIGTILGLESDAGPSGIIPGAPEVVPAVGRFSKDRTISPKQFLLQKQPRTDVERVACLAYYLTYYRNQNHFKTLDISKLNTEAAQIKFSNAAKSVDNATALGYLAPATKGNKQISAPGEVFVETLPDRAAAQEAMAKARPRRRSKRQTRKES